MPSKAAPEKRDVLGKTLQLLWFLVDNLDESQGKAWGVRELAGALKNVVAIAAGILDGQFWMLAPSERTDHQIEMRAESMIARGQPDYLLPSQ